MWLVVVLFAILANVEARPDPIIGVLGVPIENGCETVSFGSSGLHWEDETVSSCFASCYVQWLESGGARVVPIPYNVSLEEGRVESLFSSLNGLLFTGGGVDLTPNSTFYKTANAFFQLATHRPLEHFPLWGSCQGFELLHILAAQDGGVLAGGFDSENIPWPLDPTAAWSSSHFGAFMASMGVSDILSTKNVTMNFHQMGVPPSNYQRYPALASFFRILSTNKDRKGRSFVSTVEGIKFPIFATQWHPERPQFEFNSYDAIPHDLDALRANQAVATFFVEQCKRNDHRFPSSEAEEKALVYNYRSVYEGGSTVNYYF